MKKVIVLLLAVLMIIPFAACGAPQDTPADPGTSKAPVTEDTPETPPEEVTLTLWTIATESDSYHEPYNKAIAEFEANHPGVKIVHETFENESYKPKIKSAVAANELPDIFFTWGGGFSADFVASGRILSVDEVYEQYKDELPEAMLGNLTWDDKKYGSVYTMNVSMLFYNKKMFADAGVQPPKSYDELKAVCQAFIDKGITPFGISAKDIWNLAMAHDALTLKSAGAGAVKSVLLKDGAVSYNSPAFLDASKKWVDLVKMGAYSDSAIGLTNDEACATFYAGQVPMYIMGSWMPGSILTDAPDPENFSAVPVPLINSGNAALTDFMGGPSDSLMVSASTKYPELAAQAMFEISRGVSHYGYLGGSGLPAWKIDYDDSSVNPITREVAGYVAGATSFTLWFDTLLTAEDANVYLDNLQHMYLGDVSPEDFVKNMAAQLGT